jgi:hypothetical protein
MATFKRGSIWWYEFVFDGRRIRESSHSKKQEIAERMEWKRFETLNEGRQGIAKPTKHKLFGGEGRPKSTIPAGAAKDYLLEREAHWSPKTREIHATSLSHLQHHFGKMLLNEITDEDISRYQRERKKESASNRTVNIEIELVRLVLRKAKLWSRIADDVHLLSQRSEVGRELSDDEIDRLLNACNASRSHGLYTAVLTSIHTGLRSQELRLLRWRQVDLIEGTITSERVRRAAAKADSCISARPQSGPYRSGDRTSLTLSPGMPCFPGSRMESRERRAPSAARWFRTRPSEISPSPASKPPGRRRRRRLASNVAGMISGIRVRPASQPAAQPIRRSRHCWDG